MLLNLIPKCFYTLLILNVILQNKKSPCNYDMTEWSFTFHEKKTMSVNASKE